MAWEGPWGVNPSRSRWVITGGHTLSVAQVLPANMFRLLGTLCANLGYKQFVNNVLITLLALIRTKRGRNEVFRLTPRETALSRAAP